MRKRTQLIAALVLLARTAAGQVVLDPVTVSATRAPATASQVPFTVEAVPPEAFSDDGYSQTVDDVLRGSADFSLFRRNDSMTANPTSQGVSLRGLGPSGASRSLVLLDGIPLNDPFGGWVPWSMLPPGSIDRAEIVPGGGATAWGNDALAGVIQLFTRRIAPGDGEAAGRWGAFDTRSADLAQAVPLGSGALELRGSAFATDGPELIAPSQRGLVDVPAASHHEIASADWYGSVGPAATADVKAGYFEEWRNNGTPYQQNRLRSEYASASLAGAVGTDGSWSATAYGEDQQASQTFSSINALRTAETPASNQYAVPATTAGLAATRTWKGADGSETTAGGDLRGVRGETREDFSYSQGHYADERMAGGEQDFAGLFAERSQPLGAGWEVLAGLRLDRWEDSEGHRREWVIATGAPTLDSEYPARTGTELSPSAGLSWKPAEGWKLHAAAQHAFRRPTLNELYRPFRQGSTQTLANPDLATEHADSAEIGAAWSHGPWQVSVDGFAARLQNAVANVTLAQGPGTFPLFGTLAAGATGQERLNLGRVDTSGVQVGASWSPKPGISLEVSAIDESAVVGSAPVEPALVGRTSPEVPHWAGSAGVRVRPWKRLSAELRVRATGRQYDDDQNLLPLASAVVADASVQLELNAHAEVFLSLDNLGDATIETAHSSTGVFSIAPPFAAGAGAKIRW